MNESERGNLYLAIQRAHMFSDRIKNQLQRAWTEGAGEPFRLHALVEAAQELGLAVMLVPTKDANNAEDDVPIGSIRASLWIPSPPVEENSQAVAMSNSDAVLLALADALAVEVPA